VTGWFSSNIREAFLILRALPEMAEGLFLKLEEGKRLGVKKFWREKDLKTLVSKSLAGHLNSAIIVAAEPELVSVAALPAVLRRERPKEPIAAVELENFLAQFAGKVFNRCRRDAAQKLQVDELDVVLVGSRVGDFRLDGHRVLNPAGFGARRVNAVLELTFTSREIFEGIKPILDVLKRRSGGSFIFSDVTLTELKVLERVYRPPVSLLVLTPNRSRLVNRERSRELKWQMLSLVRALCDAWAVSPPVGEKLYSAYLARDTSPAVARAISREIQPLIRPLLAEIEKSRPRGKVFLDSDVGLPLSLPLKKRAFSLEAIPLSEIMFKLGIEGDEGKLSFRWLAPLMEFLTEKDNPEVNRWLRRHLHWLGSPV
jgi:hypothetical protein